MIIHVSISQTPRSPAACRHISLSARCSATREQSVASKASDLAFSNSQVRDRGQTLPATLETIRLARYRLQPLFTSSICKVGSCPAVGRLPTASGRDIWVDGSKMVDEEGEPPSSSARSHFIASGLFKIPCKLHG